MIQLMPPGRLRLGILASGRGSNFEAIAAAIQRGDLAADIALVISDRPQAKVLALAAAKSLDNMWVNPADFADKKDYETVLVQHLLERKVDLVVLAGYMRLVGAEMLNSFPRRIVNIHPALLPSFPGLHAQKQALDYGVFFSGCSVHLVDDGMDTGPILAQAVVPVKSDDTEETLSARILTEEHDLYWRVLQYLAQGRVYLEQRKIVIE